MRRLIVITGPTASGKSALAVSIARRLNTEIISADSRQIFRGMPIVTAVPSPEEREGVKHHLLECLDPEAYYSAAMFEDDALSIAGRLWDEGHEDVVVCGGSMMYVDALCHGIDQLPTVPDDIREGLKRELDERGAEWLREELRRVDPVSYNRVDLLNTKRVFHAVEITRAAGRPYSELCTGQRVSRPFEIIKLAIDLPREQLFDRINRRVDMMRNRGLVEECRRLYPLKGLNSLNTVGVKEMFDYFEGRWDLETAIARMAKNTRVYAKKQLTWLKRDPEIVWVKPEALANLPFLNVKTE